ncbi:MAG: hypothetical protein NC124_20700 [Clostridium sp.]|nr:hypothetical protein [Clostridium sp.]MCM1540414.1 hypothetical protein [Blautia sp.]
MNKREKKVAIITNYIGNVSNSWPVYSYGKIPETRAANACSTYAGAVHPKDVLGLVDISISGNGKKGLLFTEYYVYYNNGFFGNQGKVSYKEVNESGTIPSALFDAAYNRQALIELVSALAYIEGGTVQATINSLDESIAGATDKVRSVSDTISKAADFVNALADLFGGGNGTTGK